jgi:hypothetical protein
MRRRRLAGGNQPEAGSLECAMLGFRGKGLVVSRACRDDSGGRCMARSISESVSKRRRHRLKLARILVERALLWRIGENKQAELVLSCVNGVSPWSKSQSPK